MATELTDLDRAAAAVAKARARLEAAIASASAAGHSTRTIGERVGMSHEGVRKILRAMPTPDAEAVNAEAMQARLVDLDARWDRFIDSLKDRYMPSESARKSEQAFRNGQNGRAKRQAAGRTRDGKLSGSSAWKSTVRPTVTNEARRFAETFALGFLEKNSAHPVCVKVLRELDEAAALREALEAIQNARVPFLHD